MSLAIEERERLGTEYKQQPFAEFFSRLRIQHRIIDAVKKGGECWPYNSGSYQDCEHALLNQRSIGPDLSQKLDQGLEFPNFHNYLPRLIGRLLRNSKTDKPVVLLDMGGGAGQTWREVAVSFEEEVKRGKLAFVVSNLAWPLTEGEKLVNFIDSTFHTIVKKTIILPNGEVLPLKRNVDVVHESQSLVRWSQIPELDIPSITRLLSDCGSYYISAPTTPCKYTPAENQEDNWRQRVTAMTQAFRWLQENYGLKRVVQVEAGEYDGADLLYRVFRRPMAPPVAV